VHSPLISRDGATALPLLLQAVGSSEPGSGSSFAVAGLHGGQ
jgi:hypothetical protein